METEPLFNIGDEVINTSERKGEIIAYTLRDKMWSERHQYKVRYANFKLFEPREEWILQPFISKIID